MQETILIAIITGTITLVASIIPQIINIFSEKGRRKLYYSQKVFDIESLAIEKLYGEIYNMMDRLTTSINNNDKKNIDKIFFEEENFNNSSESLINYYHRNIFKINIDLQREFKKSWLSIMDVILASKQGFSNNNLAPYMKNMRSNVFNLLTQITEYYENFRVVK